MADFNRQLIVSTSPHARGPLDVRRIMLDVIIALCPALIAATYFFGARALLVVAVSVTASVATELVCGRIIGGRPTVGDLSAVVTGILLAFNLPPGIPLWMAFVGGVFCMCFGKMVFGGLGKNIFNPALIGRAAMLASFPVAMTHTWLKPFWWQTEPFNFLSIKWDVVDTVTSATPLIKGETADPFTLWQLFVGNVGGCIGETSVICMLLGGLYLLWRGHVRWQMPVSYIGVMAVLTCAFNADGSLAERMNTVAVQVCAGGLMLGAWFMATDMVTSPLSNKGQLIGGALCGLLTFTIRKWGGYPEGVSYSILLMNAATPLIDKFTMPKKYGIREGKDGA
ncbi:MAG: RnfABCDGE type electron transport complex subunit D [Candidatus Hydrogenedentes bacterium]|nr:RnfABCDGE type electron transport complex subunit D [Candidatus Hydrogenedentota bacterium]